MFFAADIHGSEVCFRKFVNAAGFYRADVLVLGGDITGKALVPIVRERDERYRVRFMGRERVVEGDELLEVERLIRFNGFYPVRVELEQLRAMEADREAVDGAFGAVMQEQVRGWVALAEERLSGTGVRCFVMPGNDDEAYVPGILDASNVVVNHDRRVVEVGEYRIAGYGWSNPTPWGTPREKTDEEIERDLSELLAHVGDPETLIFNPHVPPYDTGLDLAPELRPDLSIVLHGGQPNMVPVGSRAVRRSIEDHQPLLALSGHIHESRGVTRLGHTVCVNPGSEYNVGRLLGALVDLAEGRVKGVQLVAG